MRLALEICAADVAARGGKPIRFVRVAYVETLERTDQPD
jgi:hypothetical protein